MNIEIKKSKKPIKYKYAIDLMEQRLEEVEKNKSDQLIWILEHEDIYIVALSAFIATNCESVLGIVLQGKKKWITNEFINFLNTTIGALVSILIKMISF